MANSDVTLHACCKRALQSDNCEAAHAEKYTRGAWPPVYGCFTQAASLGDGAANARTNCVNLTSSRHIPFLSLFFFNYSLTVKIAMYLGSACSPSEAGTAQGAARRPTAPQESPMCCFDMLLVGRDEKRQIKPLQHMQIQPAPFTASQQRAESSVHVSAAAHIRI